MSRIRLSDFPRSFWVANLMELFERAAYYGLNSVLAVYLAGKVSDGGLGFDEQSVGFLQGIIYAAVYVIPIVGGALADRYGYRRMLMVAFTLLSLGYFLAGHVTGYGTLFASLLVMALGGGLFKPVISGTIVRTTDDRTSAFGFGIFYWVINVGAFLAPLLVTRLRAIGWTAVFHASALYTGAMLLPAALLYRDPPRPEATRSLREVLLGAGEVLGDARFMLMIVIYSGFWILYFQNFSTTLWYLGDFVDAGAVSAAVSGLLGALGLPATFKMAAEHVTVINAGTIILLQMVISRIVKDRPALPTMIAGMLMGAVGFALLASSQNGWIFVTGMAVFSIGEMTAHPKYYSFIGLVAPADRKAVYMGYGFLYGVFGALLGSNLGSMAYKAMLKPYAGTPEAGTRAAWFWGAFALLDVVAAVGLLAFARAFGEDNERTRRQAHKVMQGVYAVLALLGAGFLVMAVGGATVQYKTAVQASLFIALGTLGLLFSRRKPGAPA